MNEREKATIEQLYEQLGNNFDITICSDIVNGLYFEYKQLYYENEQLKEQLELSERARKEAIELVKNNQRKDEFVELNEWLARDLLNILDVDKGE